jgi:hypothetical protein
MIPMRLLAVLLSWNFKLGIPPREHRLTLRCTNIGYIVYVAAMLEWRLWHPCHRLNCNQVKGCVLDLESVCLSVCLAGCLFVYLTFCVSVFVCLSVSLSPYPSVCLFSYLCLSVCLCLCLSVCLSVSVYMSGFLSVCLFVRPLSVCSFP